MVMIAPLFYLFKLEYDSEYNDKHNKVKTEELATNFNYTTNKRTLRMSLIKSTHANSKSQ